MFQISDRAARILKTALSKAEVSDNACFRIGVVDKKVNLAIDEERPGDTTVEHEGEPLVFN